MTEKYRARLIREAHPQFDYREDDDDDETAAAADAATLINYLHRYRGQKYTSAGWQDAIDRSETLEDYDHAMAELHKDCVARLKTADP